jgi:predicted membrane protein
LKKPSGDWRLFIFIIKFPLCFLPPIFLHSPILGSQLPKTVLRGRLYPIHLAINTRQMATTPYKRNFRSGKTFGGLILITIGCIFLIDRLGAHLPRWITSWPMILILLGIYIGFRDQFKKPGAFILIAIGVFFISGDIIPGLDLRDFILPFLFISLGGYLIMGRNRQRWRSKWSNNAGDFQWSRSAEPADFPGSRSETEPVNPEGSASEQSHERASAYFSSEDYIDSVSVFGGVKKNVTSKNFRGGEIVNFMGGAEINLNQADFTGTIILDVTQIFGGTKIIVPPHWHVHSEMSAIFGSVEDKRPIHPESADNSRKLVIKGTSIFGGIDIRSF